MLEIRRSQQRGQGHHGWLNSRYSFSFAGYMDPKRMGFSVLRVINDDEIAPGTGFATHAHRDMEIISVILQGTIEHKDSMGHVLQLQAGDVQRMSAGTGVTHSEYNASQDEILHLLQIWIEPNQMGVTPGYEQLELADNGELGDKKLKVLASPDRRDGSMFLHQDAVLSVAHLTNNETLPLSLNTARKYYLHMIAGEITTTDQTLTEGDALTIENENSLQLQAKGDAKFLLFDLP
ncbi:MAG: pirin family protein [Gammaproteobacteria bacterium]|nr:pirin family protein [Gammaproteobacteria bacterium]MCF6261848.1 pirin family protein [Gammaproteobacteria bacterium]